MEYINKNPSTSLEDAFKSCQPDVYNKLFGNKTNNNAASNSYLNSSNSSISESVSDGYTDHINMSDYADSKCCYQLDQILKGKFKQKCDTIFDNVTDSTQRKMLEDILFRGQVGDYTFASDTWHKDNPSLEGQRRIDMANLYLNNPDTFKVICEKKIDLFHGTNGVALSDISKNGLMSFHDLNQSGYDVQTGEKWSRIPGYDRSFISFADILDISTFYSSQTIDGTKMDFPILIGITTDVAEANGTVNVSSDISEVGVLGVPADQIGLVCVPADKVAMVQKMFEGTNTTVMPLDFDAINNNKLYSY